MASSSEKLQTCFKVQQDHLNGLGQSDGCSPPHRAQGMSQLPRRMPEPILHHEKGHRIHHQGTVNQRASVPFTIFLRFSRCCKPKKKKMVYQWKQNGISVCVCVCWVLESSLLEGVCAEHPHCPQLFTEDTDKQGLEPGGLACQIRDPRLPNFKKQPFPAKSSCETVKENYIAHHNVTVQAF